jgi:hypothetical protein
MEGEREDHRRGSVGYIEHARVASAGVRPSECSSVRSNASAAQSQVDLRTLHKYGRAGSCELKAETERRSKDIPQHRPVCCRRARSDFGAVWVWWVGQPGSPGEDHRFDSCARNPPRGLGPTLTTKSHALTSRVMSPRSVSHTSTLQYADCVSMLLIASYSSFKNKPGTSEEATR